MLCTPALPVNKEQEENQTNDEWREDMGALPRILYTDSQLFRPCREKKDTYHVSAPKNAGNEQDDARDGREAANDINPGHRLLAGERGRVDPRRRAVEEEGDGKANGRVGDNHDAHVAPVGIGSNQLPPHDGGTPGQDRHDESRNVDAALRGWRNLRRGGNRCQFGDARADAGKRHAGCGQDNVS